MEIPYPAIGIKDLLKYKIHFTTESIFQIIVNLFLFFDRYLDAQLKLLRSFGYIDDLYFKNGVKGGIFFIKKVNLQAKAK